MTTQTDAPSSIPEKPGWRRVRFVVLYSLYLVVLGWIGLKLFAWFKYDVPLTRSENRDDVWRTFYPELWKSGAIETDGTGDDARLDVLLLGASVLEEVKDDLLDALKERYGDSVHVYNLAISAHTTRDSMQKYKRLLDRHFDLVIIYHGINDSRMNCVAADLYRDDYSHCGWYVTFEQKLKTGLISVRTVFSKHNRDRIGNGPPDEANLKYSENVKTGPAFEQNLETILKYAAAKKTPVVLMTFATHLVKGYSRQAFEAGELDYGKGRHQLAVEVWGTPKGVSAAVKTHNAAIRRLHHKFPANLFVDMNAKLPKNGKTFSDICHLTPAGCKRFVAELLPVIGERFKKGRGY